VRSRRTGAVVGLGLLLAPFSAPALTWAAEPVGTPERGGRVVAAKGCGTCHALPGEVRGKKPGPSFLSSVPPEATSEVLRRLWNHIPGMRRHFVAQGLSWPAFSLQEMADLLSFLGADFSRERAANLDRGRLLLVQKGCLKCHGLAGEGSRTASDLTRFREFRNPVPLATALWNKAPTMLERIDASGIPYPIFNEGELTDLLGFLGAITDVSR
jgi:mono/diheme cytochrome c family protein